MSTKVRVYRLIEIEGDIDAVERQVSVSLKGTRDGCDGLQGGKCKIRANTLGQFPIVYFTQEDLEEAGHKAGQAAVTNLLALLNGISPSTEEELRKVLFNRPHSSRPICIFTQADLDRAGEQAEKTTEQHILSLVDEIDENNTEGSKHVGEELRKRLGVTV